MELSDRRVGFCHDFNYSVGPLVLFGLLSDNNSSGIFSNQDACFSHMIETEYTLRNITSRR